MNDLLQKHGCANVFSVPEGLKELMSDITREVLRSQPEKLFEFIANYLSVLLITREHGIMAVKILDDLCDCRPSVTEHLTQLGLDHDQAELMAQIINDEIAVLEPIPGKEKIREYTIVKKILAKVTLDEEMSAHVCQVIRNTYRDYWYRKKMLKENMKVLPAEEVLPWQVAAEHTLALYKKTNPSFDELNRATLKIQAAYRGYHIRRNVLRQFRRTRKVKPGPKQELPGPPLDVAGSREIDLGRVLTVKTHEDDIGGIFDEQEGKTLGLKFNPKKTIAHVEPEERVIEDSETTKKSRGIKMAADITSSSPPKKRPQFGGFASGTKDEPAVMRTEIESVFRPIQVPKTVEAVEEKVVRKLSLRGLHSRRMSQVGYAPLISFSDVPAEVFLADDNSMEEIDQILEEPEVESPSPFVDVEDVQEELPEDITDDEVDDTVPTASSVRSSDVEDIVSDVGEEEL